MAVLDRLWTDELTDGEADHVADWTHYFSHSPNTGEDDPPDTRWEEICAFSGVKSGCEIPNLMDEVTRASTMQGASRVVDAAAEVNALGIAGQIHFLLWGFMCKPTGLGSSQCVDCGFILHWYF